MKSWKKNVTYSLILSALLAGCTQAGPRIQSDALPLRTPDMNEHTYSMREDVTPAQEFIMAQILEAATSVDGVDRAIAYSRSNFDVTIGIQGARGEQLYDSVRESVNRIAPNYKVTVIPYEQVRTKGQEDGTPPLYNPMDTDIQGEIRRRLR